MTTRASICCRREMCWLPGLERPMEKRCCLAKITHRYRITDITGDGTLRPDEAMFLPLDDDSRGFASLGRLPIGIRLIFDSASLPWGYPSQPYWAFAQTESYWHQAQSLATGGGQPQFNGNALKRVKVPLPPVEAQRQIVLEIEAEQNLVSANRELVGRMEQRIQDAIARVWEG